MKLEHSPDDLKWMDDGRCMGLSPTEFFPTDGDGVIDAQQICDGCPVIDECLEYALTNRIFQGVWGGTSERERRRILRSQGLIRPKASAQTGLTQPVE